MKGLFDMSDVIEHKPIFDYKYPIPQDTMVRFEIAPLAGTGRICGLATNPDPNLGTGYIIEVLTLSGTDVPIAYSHMVVFDRNIKAVIHPTSYDNLIKDLYAMAEANELEKLFEPAEKIPLNFLLWLQTKVNFWKRG